MRIPKRLEKLGSWLTLAALSVASMATSCVTTTAIAVNLGPDSVTDSVAADVSALVERIVARHGFGAEPGGAGHNRCWARRRVRESQGRQTDLYLCESRRAPELQFQLDQVMTTRLTPIGETIRRELLDSLRVRYGASAVRECRWTYDRDRARSGCPPLTGAAHE